jgi:hypothetical protein
MAKSILIRTETAQSFFTSLSSTHDFLDGIVADTLTFTEIISVKVE